MATIHRPRALGLVLISILLLCLVGCGGGGGAPANGGDRETTNSPPTVTITAGPSGETADTTPSFSWSGSDSDGTVVGYEYRMGTSGSWTAVSSSVTSHTFGPLPPEAYTFNVRAQDDDGECSDPASRALTIIENTGDVPIVID